MWIIAIYLIDKQLYCFGAQLIITCVRIVQCQKLGNIRNGNVDCSLADDGTSSYKDTCNVTCNPGYMLTGSDTRMCLSNGSWSGMDGECKGGTITLTVA